MGVIPAWVLLPLLQELARPGLSCSVVSRDVDWTLEFDATCLNFSGQGVQLPQDRPLRASHLQVLDLSDNGLQELPPTFFADLGRLQILNVAKNPLTHVAATLASRCDLDLQADCGCALATWHQVRQDNCSGWWSLQCMHTATGAFQNLSTFLEASCPPGLAPATIGAAVAGAFVFFGFIVAGSVLAWRLWDQRGPLGQGKGWDAQDRAGARARPGLQLKYSSWRPGPTPQGDTLTPTPTPDYENVFIGQAAKVPQQTPHKDPASEDSDFYMNYEGPSMYPQAIYCNLESQVQAPLDEEDYVVPGC
ncbi:leucine-rich repeat-containing protein 25 [Perognathus longimembris pacificus]|uniref:leucine-rich repeat-containing protein 25 n=1 Tax=Perognathus longimembris pacificus TaxID=214514 RepID=UPI002018C0B6|nr:leucine-rich repeat-containing protein 25 [Perognathus longimembris pacificus]